MWWGCVIFLAFGVVIGFFLAAILTVGKVDDLSQRMAELNELADLGYKLSEVTSRHWHRPEVGEAIIKYQKKYKKYKEMKNNG